MTEADVDAALEHLARTGLIRLYVVDGTRYADFPSWRDHQKINRPTPSRLPSFEDSVKAHGAISEPAVTVHAGSDRIGSDQGSDRIRSEATPEAATARPAARSARREKRGTDEVEVSFQAFYERYPRKAAPDSALRAWKKAIGKATLEQIMAGLKMALPELSSREEKFIPYPATWLNDGAWRNAPPAPESYASRDKINGLPGMGGFAKFADGPMSRVDEINVVGEAAKMHPLNGTAVVEVDRAAD